MRPAVAAVVAALSAGLLGLSQDLDSTPYLAGDRAPDTAAILPSAPLPGSVRAQADQAIFRQTRALEGSPRWTLAQNDVAEAVPAVLADFSCASQAKLGEVDAPKLAHILRRLRFDVVTAVNHPKALYDRKRPYLQDAGDICVAKSPDLAASPDYPSGHATWGWAVGLILAELEPDRATAILGRARAFGESRVVCGVHSASAVEAGRTNAAALVAALHGDAAFRADMDAARGEMAALREKNPQQRTEACAAEAALTAKAPW